MSLLNDSAVALAEAKRLLADDGTRTWQQVELDVANALLVRSRRLVALRREGKKFLRAHEGSGVPYSPEGKVFKAALTAGGPP